MNQMKKNPVVHFEMPYEDQARVAAFYEKAFGWQMTKTGEEMGNYIVAGTTDTDANRMVKTPGTINGGFFKKGPTTSTMPSVVISVEDIKKAMEDVKAAGGKISAEVVEIPGIGLWVPFEDSEGNRVSLLQAKRM
jgi:predicted enzyme related to lactoylglutathione lyase